MKQLQQNTVKSVAKEQQQMARRVLQAKRKEEEWGKLTS